MDNENQSETIGQKLHDARVAKGYTLDDLQKNTKIQKRYLMAIEENDFDALPGDFYVRAFVKQYADSVGLNGQELLNEFNHNLPDTEAPEYVDRVMMIIRKLVRFSERLMSGVKRLEDMYQLSQSH
ncbi:helix-turn-helix domain-containing protein [Lentilactobacillus kosonis]|uniref:Transcriptional regulator n=1 Tax=Lentilactobacillus kosonis TaxID=2810561 RepID=A0A401FNC2_9LACO|nr:hypothetical protein NBRC111893_1904 [Lentilactobacillus kosonis]